MILAQTITQEVQHVIDAKLVGLFLLCLTLGIIPMVRWLGGMAVASTLEKFTGLKVEVTDIKRLYEEHRSRQDDHGRKLDVVRSDAGHAYNKAVKAHDVALALEVRAAELQKDVDHAKEKAETAFQKAVEVEGGLAEMAVQHGRLDMRVEQTEKDIDGMGRKGRS